MAGFSREVARRIFAEELRNSNLSFRDGDDQHQYAPQYLLTPTGARCNRIFLVGTLTERDDIGGDNEYWRGRVVDPTGSILVYAGQYQPEAAQALANIEPPAFVAVVGKPSLYQTEDGNIIISIRAEAIQKADETLRDQWILDTAKRTYERLKNLEGAGSSPLSSEFSAADKVPAVSPALDADRARLHYNTDIEQYRHMVIRALTALRADLAQGESTVKADGAKAVKKDASLELGSDLSKPKPDASKKPRSKSSSVKGKAPSVWPEEAEIEDIETFDFGKKS
jgi:RPA family protein